MRPNDPTARNEDFHGAIQDFGRWRTARTRGARIPPDLWQTATALADRHGVSRTATALGLDYYALKKRLFAGRNDALETASVRGAPAQFVEVSLAGVTSSVSCAVEVERWIDDARHSKLRLELKGLALCELESLLHSIWSSAT